MPSDDDIALVDRRQLKWDQTNPDTLLGEGSFGVVHRGRFNGTPVAIKVVKRPPPAENASEEDKIREHAALKQHRREIHRFKVVQNPHIIQYLGVFRGEHPRDLFIVTEFLEGGSLYDSLSKMRARKAILDDRSFLQVATHIAWGLNHVHASQYTHGDMKPQNILLTSAFQFVEDEIGNITASIPVSAKVKIADFGLSKRLDGAESAGLFGSTTATTDFGTGPCGTYLYMSPEAYEGVSKLSDSQAKAADVYAFGLVLFELLSGLQSWGLERVKNPMQLSAFVRSGKRPAWGPREECIDPAYIELVSQCWSQNPEDRPIVDDIVTVLEDQQKKFDRRLTKQEKPSQVFSDVTRHEDSSPECEQRKAGEHRVSDQAIPRLSNGTARYGITDPCPSRHETDTSKQPVRADAQGRVCQSDNSSGEEHKCAEELKSDEERRTNETDTDDDAHTLEDGEDIFSSSEDSGPPAIRKIDSVRLTDSEVALYRSKRSENTTVTATDYSDSDKSEADTESLPEGEEDSEEEPEEEEGAVYNAVCDLPTANGIGDLNAPENIDDRYMDSIVGAGVNRVMSVRINAPDIGPLALPEHTDTTRPTLGLGTIDDRSGLQGGGFRKDSEVLASFIRGANIETEKNNGTTGQVPSDPQGQSPDDSESVSERFQGIALGPEKAPELPEAPFEQVEPANGDSSSAISHPQTPEETEAAKVAAQQNKAKIYSSPNVEEGELSSLSDMMDFPPGSGLRASSFFPSSDESKSSETWPSSSQAFQNGPARPVHSINSVPATAPAGAESTMFLNSDVAPNTDYTSASVQHGHSHQPNPYGSLTSQGASAPPLSETSQSALGGPTTQSHHHLQNNIPSPAWASPGSNYLPHDSLHRIPNMNLGSNISMCPQSVDSNTVISALQRHDAVLVLRDWWQRGHVRAVASGLARAHAIGGEDLLDLVRDFTDRNNKESPERRNPVVAKDLCAAIGHIARNASQPLSPDAVIRTVREVLSVLPSFQSIARQRNDVYSFANFALCNLFKVYNVIGDYNLRMLTASWIAFSISWNVAQENKGPYDEVLAYTATSAARNFMWMNEQNVEAFVGCNRDKLYVLPPPPMTLIMSMRCFDWTGRLSVVEASLSAMAMIIHFPRQRAEFMKVRGAEAVTEVLDKHANNSEITSLAFWMITVLFSGPPSNHTPEEVDILRRAFAEQNGCQKFAKALEKVNQYAPTEKQKVESLEKGYNAMLTVARFGGPLRAHMIEAGCMPVILNAVRQLARSPAMQYSSADESLVKARGRLGVVLCELISEVSNEHEGMSYMRDNNVRYPLQDMMKIHRADDGFTSCCRVALTKLAY